MTDYYVSPTGIDSNTGLSEAKAWKTIQKAANSASAGDTVHVLAGTYNEQVNISRSGTAGSPIIFQGEGKPIITYTGAWVTDSPVVISGSYITITGFKIMAYDTVYDSSLVIGVMTSWGSGATNINISNNYIWTQSGYGIDFAEKSGNNSVIHNNEIRTGHQAAIILFTVSAPKENITITNNTIYADENRLHRDYSDASGIWTHWGYDKPACSYSLNLNVSNNKIMCSGYTAIKIAGGGHKINYNEIGPNGFVHNAIETTMCDSEIIGNRIYDTNLSWVVHTNSFYPAGMGEYKNLIIRDNIIENSSGRGLTTGGDQHDVLVENLTVKNYQGFGIMVMGFENPTYPLPVYSSDDLMFVNVNLTNFYSTTESPIIIISLGTRLDNGSWARDDNTFINPKITGSYTRPTWWLTNQIAYDVNKHFEGTVHVINSNKNDVLITKDSTIGTFDGEIIFYYYIDVQVVDKNGNPVEGAKVSFAASDPTMKAKNVNYTYEPFPGKTEDIDYTYTKVDGHTPLPSYSSETVAITDFKQTIIKKTYYTWTITAEKFGATNTTTVSPDITWYRDDPNIPAVASKIQIQLPIEITNGAVIGKVIDYSGSPLKDVSININGTIVFTDINGDYGLGDLVPNTYNMSISKTGYITISDQFIITTNEVITKNFALSLETGCPIPICEFTLIQL